MREQGKERGSGGREREVRREGGREAGSGGREGGKDKQTRCSKVKKESQ